MRNAAMSGIGSAIEVSGKTFEPYVQNVYNMCIEILKVAPSPQLTAVRAMNLEAIAKLCNTFCKKDYAHR